MMGLETERAKGLRERGGSGCRAGEVADKGEWCGGGGGWGGCC
jgi:hypothetical protein